MCNDPYGLVAHSADGMDEKFRINSSIKFSYVIFYASMQIAT